MRRHVLGAALVLVVMAQCLDPTEVTLVLGTDLPCDQANGVAVAIGADRDGGAPILARSRRCVDGGLGTVVVVPGNSSRPVTVRVSLGVVDASAGDECTPPNFEGCIVARRSLEFIEHRPLVLPIQLQRSCLDVACGPNATCADGNCVPLTTMTGGDASAPIAACDPPLFIASSTATSPRVARTSQGYAVGYALGGAYETVTVNAGVVSAPHKIGLFPALGTIGPLGATGEILGASYRAGTTDAGSVQVGIIDPAGKSLGECGSGPAEHTSVSGLPYVPEGDAGVFLTAAIEGGHPTVAFCHPSLFGGGGSQKLGIDGGVNPALAAGEGKFYLMWQSPESGSCQIYPFTYAAGALKFEGGYVFSPCLALRLAVSPGRQPLYLANTTSGIVGASIGPPTGGVATFLGRADDQSIIALPSGDGYRVFWGRGGNITTTRFKELAEQPLPSPVVTETGFDATAGLGIGFDAIDGPGTEYAVAYWTSQGANGAGVYFQQCR